MLNPLYADRAVVVFSGGQDSTTCLLQAIQKYGTNAVRTITFQYGQRHSIELESAKNICQHLQIRQKIVTLSELSGLTESALLDQTSDIKQPPGQTYPNTFVAGRNALFILYAAIYAREVQAQNIILGVSEADYSGYPDCRQPFIQAMNTSINLAMDADFVLRTPLMFLNKEEIWALADRLGQLEFVRRYSHTCYLGVEGGCGQCPSCRLRETGLRSYLERKKAAIPGP